MMNALPIHQYIDRASGTVKTEQLLADRSIHVLYRQGREYMPALFKALTSARTSRLLGWLNYDRPPGSRRAAAERLVRTLGVDLSECCDPEGVLASPRCLFERRIRYWDRRPMPAAPDVVTSPADARLLVTSLSETSLFFVKEKFFDLEELLGPDKPGWRGLFAGGDAAILRLTPDKYHYNHAPVSGRVADIYLIDGDFHSCNPAAVVRQVTPYSKNRRVVTIIDTDVPGGTGVGPVAMIEIVALMIGDIVQCYSERRYDDPKPVTVGMFLQRGQPKSLYRPGSSVDVLLFAPGRIDFCPDLRANTLHAAAQSRFSRHFGRPLVETDVAVRSPIAARKERP